MIGNLVFDMGNVLLVFDPEVFMDREKITGREDRRALRNELFRSAEWAMMDLGLLTEHTAEPRIVSRLPEHLQEPARHLLHHWSDERETVEGMEELVSSLKGAGYRLFLLSNASVSQPSYWERLPLSRYFEGTLVSAFEKVVKPMPEIYRLFTERFGLLPSECLFIDDAPLNVAAAMAEGWEGIVFHGDIQELSQKLREKGVDW